MISFPRLLLSRALGDKEADDWVGEGRDEKISEVFCFRLLVVESEQQEVTNDYLSMLEAQNCYHTWFHLYAWLIRKENGRCK